MSAVMEEEDRITFPESLGCAANARDLTVRESGGQVDKIIGLGMTLAELERHPGKRPELKEIERELIPVLWRMKAGEQAAYERHAVVLFAEWMIRKGRFTDELRLLAECFAKRLIHEWLHETCTRCRGAGLLERVGGAWVRPVGNQARNPRYALCDLCHGNRRAQPRHGERARHFGIPMTWYDSNDWPRRFIVGLASLDAMMGRLNRALAKRFRRGSEPPVVEGIRPHARDR